MTYDPTLKAALSEPVVNLFCAIEIAHPVATLRLLDGGATLIIDGQAFVGHDETYGRLGNLEATDDGEGDEAPTLKITFHAANAAQGVALAAASAQGAAVKCMIGAFDPQTGAVVGEPYVWFIGEIDVITLSLTGLTFECVSAFERFFEDDQGARLVAAWLQSFHPGDLGLSYVTDVEQQMPWGAEGVRPAVVTVTNTPNGFAPGTAGYYRFGGR